MARPEEITEVLKQLMVLCRQVTEWASSENVSYRMLKDDISAISQKHQDLIRQTQEIEKYNLDLKKQSEGIISKAQMEADQIRHLVREKLAEAHKKEAIAAMTVEKANQAKYLAEKKLDEVVENYAKAEKDKVKNGK